VSASARRGYGATPGEPDRASPGLVANVVAGPAAAVYGASEGLSTLVLEPEAIGGQAGTSSLIRNYLGFPAGVSGADLAVRAYTQAWNFGAEYVYGNPATGLRPEGSELVVTVADGSEVRSRAVVIATGMAYRRLIPGIHAGVPSTPGPEKSTQWITLPSQHT